MDTFFIRNHFIMNLHVESERFKELVLIKTKSLKNFSISNIVVTANN